ncbi:hypothetical protein BDN72DRAFT_830243 [Pluteus cervinus]|uniref:Uncharacterized protein n=1 Tax=Pluteus cervinus TaxID=181527 RepID=A0ACD3BH44_9AGAR|nr:hypothetical protein BDN72DRAFT_830243 [Pluteus cervinus]
MPFIKGHYQPFLFAMMTCSAVAELGLTAFLISAGNENHTWPSPRYHSLLIFFLFNAVWTVLFASAYLLWMMGSGSQLLASIASSIFWLLITTLLWGTAAALMLHTRSGGNCARVPTISRCRQSLTVMAIGFTELALCIIALLSTCLWVYSSNRVYKEEAQSKV